MPNPPAVAELILRGLLPLDMRETVSGDLLEEYRESRVPAVGEFRADLWYWRQVGGMWLRAYWWLVVPVVLLLVVSDVFNTYRAPSGASYLDGLPTLVTAVMSPIVGAVGLLGLATVYGSWRTRRWQGGLVAALGVSVLVWLFMVLWVNATFQSFAQVQQANPYWIQAWHWSIAHHHAAPDETFVHWLYWDNVGALVMAGIVLLVTPFVFGGIAAVIGEIQVIRGVLLGLVAALLVSIGLTGPRPVPPLEVALWAATGGPPLDFEAAHDGQVVAHMDLMRGLPPAAGSKAPGARSAFSVVA